LGKRRKGGVGQDEKGFSKEEKGVYYLNVCRRKPALRRKRGAQITHRRTLGRDCKKEKGDSTGGGKNVGKK